MQIKCFLCDNEVLEGQPHVDKGLKTVYSGTEGIILKPVVMHTACFAQETD